MVVCLLKSKLLRDYILSLSDAQQPERENNKKRHLTEVAEPTKKMQKPFTIQSALFDRHVWSHVDNRLKPLK